MKTGKGFSTIVLLLATLGLAGCPIPPDNKQKGTGPAPEQSQEREPRSSD